MKVQQNSKIPARCSERIRAKNAAKEEEKSKVSEVKIDKKSKKVIKSKKKVTKISKAITNSPQSSTTKSFSANYLHIERTHLILENELKSAVQKRVEESKNYESIIKSYKEHFSTVFNHVKSLQLQCYSYRDISNSMNNTITMLKAKIREELGSDDETLYEDLGRINRRANEE